MPSPTVAPRIILDPRDEPETAQLLQRRHAPYDGVVVVDLWLPSRRTTYALADQCVGAIEKRLIKGRAQQNTTLAWALAQSWLQAIAPDHLVVTRAHLWPARAWQRLTELASPAGVQLWLLVQGTAMHRGQKEFARDMGITPEDISVLLQAVPERPGDLISGPRRRGFPAVPGDEFPTFLETGLATLEPADARVLAHAYWRQLDETLADFEAGRAGSDAWLAKVVEIIGRESAGDLNENLTRLRAVQAAALRHGCLASVDAESLAAGYTSQPLAAPTPENLLALRPVPDPRSAALAVLSLSTHQPPPALALLNLEDVEASGEIVRLEGETFAIPRAGAYALRALRLLRLWEGAAGGDPLFVSEDRSHGANGQKRITAHGLQMRLTRTAKHTGLILTSRDSWGHGEPRRWLDRRGIRITPLEEDEAC